MKTELSRDVDAEAAVTSATRYVDSIEGWHVLRELSQQPRGDYDLAFRLGITVAEAAEFYRCLAIAGVIDAYLANMSNTTGSDEYIQSSVS